MSSTILILEDDDDRRRRFSAVAAALGRSVQFWHASHVMIAEWTSAHADCQLLSLDCDLIPPDGSDAWGDGIEVAEFLASCSPIAPVIVHSTNRDGSRRMMLTLADAGWNVHRVVPIGDDWIEHDWRIEVERLTRPSR